MFAHTSVSDQNPSAESGRGSLGSVFVSVVNA